MCFERVQLLIGFRVNASYLKLLVKHKCIKVRFEKADGVFSEDDETFIEEVLDDSVFFSKFGFHIFSQVCCAQDGNTFVIGKIVKEYHVTNMDTGETTNGVYDADSIHDGNFLGTDFKHCPRKHVCAQCWHDNRATFSTCAACGNPPSPVNESKEYKSLTSFIKKVCLDSKVFMYYTLDGCPTCSGDTKG